MKGITAIAFAAAVACAGCGSGASQPSAPPEQAAELACAGCGDAADACEVVEGRTFESDAELECGLALDGPAKCHWQLTFEQDGTFRWLHSDVSESGTYSCEGDTLYGEVTGDRVYEGTVDAEADILVWEDQPYHPAP